MSAPVDSEARLASRPSGPDVGKVLRVREVLRITRVVLGLVLLLGISSLAAASRTAAADGLNRGIALWYVGQVAAIGVVVLGLRGLRRLRFGAAPSSSVRATSDGLLAIAACVGGAIALAGFAPGIAAGTARGVDVAIVAIGAVLALAGLRVAALYVLRA